MKSNKNRLTGNRTYLLLILCLPFFVQAEEITISNQDKFSLSIHNTEVAEVFDMLSQKGKVNIVVGSGISGEITVNLYDVTLENAIRTISTSAGLAVEFQNDTYFIMTHEEAGKDILGDMTELKAFKVQYTDPEIVADILTNHLSRHGKITTMKDRRVIVVEEIPSFMQRIEGLIADLDSQPKQILIEARILEITLDDTETFGIDWRRLFTTDSGTGNEGAGVFGTQGLSTPGTPGFFFSFVNSNIDVALDALNSKGRVKTLSSPKLLALEHREAEVVIGDRTGYRVTTTINAVTTESVAFLESGVILKVTPYVDQNNQIMMDIHPEVSTPTISDGIPSISTTEVTTQFLAKDGQTIFIAGLMRNSSGRSRTGVPLISDIPLIGRAFRHSEDIVINTETVVLITPRIVDPGTDPYLATEVVRIEEIDVELKEEVRKLELILDSNF